MTVSEEKQALRRQLLAERKSLNGVEKSELDAVLCAKVAATKAFQDADLILGFMPIRGEPDLTALFETAFASGKQIALPRCEKSEMRFLPLTPKTVCVPDKFGILTPPADSPAVTCTTRTLCLLPGLAATREGTRLGYGGGFYDRFLATFPGHTLLALYHRFLCESLPREPFDIAAEIVLTEKGFFSNR